MSVPAPLSLGGFRDSMNRVTMSDCDLRYLRTGADAPGLEKPAGIASLIGHVQ